MSAAVALLAPLVVALVIPTVRLVAYSVQFLLFAGFVLPGSPLLSWWNRIVLRRRVDTRWQAPSTALPFELHARRRYLASSLAICLAGVAIELIASYALYWFIPWTAGPVSFERVKRETWLLASVRDLVLFGIFFSTVVVAFALGRGRPAVDLADLLSALIAAGVGPIVGGRLLATVASIATPLNLANWIAIDADSVLYWFLRLPFVAAALWATHL